MPDQILDPQEVQNVLLNTKLINGYLFPVFRPFKNRKLVRRKYEKIFHRTKNYFSK